MTETQLFQNHIDRLRKTTATALKAEKYDALAIYAGTSQLYFADDLDIPFRPTPHFNHWCPLRSEEHVLLVRGDERPTLYLNNKPSYWVDNEVVLDAWWADNFTIAGRDDLVAELSKLHAAWIGPEVDWLPQNIDRNPDSLRARLDAVRSVKSEYEVACIKAANKIACRGHARLQECFAAGESEFAMHLAYLQATEQTDSELPYPTVIALDDKAAVLHYQHKRRDLRNGKVLLADCGARVHGYASDVTRTWSNKHAHPLFAELLQQMQTIQQELCASVKSGVAYYDLHYLAHEKIATLLINTDILRNLSSEAAIADGLTYVFFPHGLGHPLGIQTHDVGGKRPPCNYTKPLLPIFKNIRLTGGLIVDEVITVEPGIYFIPMLLDQQRDNPKLNHTLLDALRPCGGIRIEDNVQVKEGTAINLTRLN